MLFILPSRKYCCHYTVIIIMVKRLAALFISYFNLSHNFTIEETSSFNTNSPFIYHSSPHNTFTLTFFIFSTISLLLAFFYPSTTFLTSITRVVRERRVVPTFFPSCWNPIFFMFLLSHVLILM